MPKQLIYSTVAEGIDGGRGNLCYAAASPGALQNEMLKSNLLQINSYQQLFTFKPNNDQNPINFCHYKFSIGNSEISVVSRIGAAQMYGGRSNFLAHHLLLDKNELPPYGPATLIRNGFKFKTEWDNQQNLETPVLPLNLTVSPGLAKAWQSIGQDPGWAGWVAEKAIEGRQIQVLYPQNLQPVHLLEDILAQVKEHQRWKITFSTYYTLGGNGPKCSVQLIPTNATNYCSNYFGKKPSENVLDLTFNLGLAPTSELSESARGQQKKQPENLIGTSKKAQNKSKTSEHGGQTHVAEEIRMPPNQEDPGTSRPPAPENGSLSGKFILACIALVIFIFFAAVLVGIGVWSHKNHFKNEVAKINQNQEKIPEINSKPEEYTENKPQLEKQKPTEDQKGSTEKIVMNKPKLAEANNFNDFERLIKENQWDGIKVDVATLKEIHRKLYPKPEEINLELSEEDLNNLIKEGTLFEDWLKKLKVFNDVKDIPAYYTSREIIESFIKKQSLASPKTKKQELDELRIRIDKDKEQFGSILMDLENYIEKRKTSKPSSQSKTPHPETYYSSENYFTTIMSLLVLFKGKDNNGNQIIDNYLVKRELSRFKNDIIGFFPKDDINKHYSSKSLLDFCEGQPPNLSFNYKSLEKYLKNPTIYFFAFKKPDDFSLYKKNIDSIFEQINKGLNKNSVNKDDSNTIEEELKKSLLLNLSSEIKSFATQTGLK